MGIDAEDVLICLWRFFRFFIDTSYVCVQKHPFVTCTFSIIFLCYVFFDLLLYHLPFIIFVAVLLRLFWSSERQEPSTRPEIREEKQPKPVADTTREISSFRRQKSRRTYFSKDRSLFVDTHENDAKLAVVHEENETRADDRSVVDAAVNGERQSLTHASDDEEDDDGEVNGKKAVEWTEDDQKNLDDLGVSEIERNRRLESLIAKRRARKLDNPGGSSPTAISVAPIFVARDSAASGGGGEGSGGPGSAPSVLEAGKNPFDIPYDPTEEKPDLTADSFQEEFTAADQKEGLSYCRHESFCWGGFGFEPLKHRRDGQLRGFTRPSGNDTLIEQLLGGTESHIDQTPSFGQSSSQCPAQQSLDSEASLDSKATNDTVVSEQDAPNDTENANNADTTDPSIVEDSETNSSSSFEVSNRSSEAIRATEPQYDTSPTANDKDRAEDSLFFGDNLATHTPSNSIASDMQVEVSEIGSPPLTIGNVSPNDADSLSFDEEVERGQLDFDMELLDNNGVVNRELEKERDSGFSYALSSSSLSEKRQKTAMRLAEEFSSFFESAYRASQKKMIPPPDEADEENVDVCNTRDSGTDTNDDAEEHEKHGDGDALIIEEAMDNMTIQSEETGLGSNEQTEQPITGDTSSNAANNNNNNNHHHEEENMREVVPNSIEETEVAIRDEKICSEDPNPGSKTDQPVVRQESFLVNKSSPSSPMSTPIGRVTEDMIFDEQPANVSSLIVPQNGNSETLQEPSALEKNCEETNIDLNVIKSVCDDKASKEESESNKDSEKEEENLETPSASATGSSQEDTEKVTQ